MPLKNKRILVTGATGFIGGRLAERLALESGAHVTGTGRNLANMARLTETGVHMRQLSLMDKDAVRDVVQDQDIIFNLAVAPGTSSPKVAQAVNVTAVENLVREAAIAGVMRVVHVSSMAAYGPPDRPIMDEDHPVDTGQSALYGRTKAQGELKARKTAIETGLELTIVRPGMVFGPRGRSWTINLFKLVNRGVPVIFGDGSGYAQPIFVDNLVDGMILAAWRPEANQEAFNFVDQSLAWRDFLAYYGEMCGRKPRTLPIWLFQAAFALVRPIIGRSESTADILTFYTSQSRYPRDKAERLLGYKPRLSIEEGMEKTKSWLIETGYLRNFNGHLPFANNS